MTTLSAVISRAKDAKDNFKEGRDKKNKIQMQRLIDRRKIFYGNERKFND